MDTIHHPFVRETPEVPVGYYDEVSYLLPPPTVSHRHRSTSGIGLLIQSGQSVAAGTQEVLSDGGAFDTMLFFVGHEHRGETRHAGTSVAIGAGASSTICIPAMLQTRWIMQGRPGPVLHLHMPPRFGADMGHRGLAVETLTGGPAGGALDRLGDYVFARLQSGLPMSSMALDGIALMALDAGSGTPPRATHPRLTPWQAKRIAEFFEATLAHDIGLAEAARTVGLSAGHFCRAFKATFGLTSNQFRMRLRLERGRRLLAESTQSITDVAAAIGYDDPSYFARLFQARFGTTPRLYRRAFGRQRGEAAGGSLPP